MYDALNRIVKSTCDMCKCCEYVNGNGNGNVNGNGNGNGNSNENENGN